MSRARAVLAGTGRLLVALAAAKALDLIAWIALARELGVESFGRYAGAIAFVLLFNIVADLGLTPVFAREVACGRAPARALLGRVLRLKAMLGGLTIVLATLAAWALRPAPGVLALTVVFAIGLVLNSAAQTFEAWLKAQGRAGTAGWTAVAQSATSALVCLALLAGGAGAWAGAIAALAGGVAHLVAAASRAGRAGDATDAGTGTGPTTRALLLEALPVALSGVCVGIYFRIDTVLLAHLSGERATGLYNGAYRFFEACVYVSAAFRSVLYPVLARAAAGASEIYAAHVRRIARGLLLATVGVAAVLSAFAPALVRLVLGPAYAESAAALAILAWALPGAFLADTLFHALVARRRAGEAAGAVAKAAALNIALNLVLIPLMSFRGAAIATVASEVVSCLLLASVLARDAGRVFDAALFARPLALGALATIAFTLAARALGAAPLAPLGACAAFACWLLVAWRWGGLGSADRALVTDALARRRPTAEAPRKAA